LEHTVAVWHRNVGDVGLDAGNIPRTHAQDRIFRLPDGRQIGYREFGDPSGVPVIALHGTPGSRFKYSGSHAVAAASGLRLVSLDRWGYGLSSSRPQPTLAGFGADVEALAGHLGIDRLAITGISGGGPFAVAAAAHLTTRVRALALVAPVGILRGDGQRTRLTAFHNLCFRVLPRIPGAIPAAFQLYRAALALAPDTAMAIAISRSAAVDREAMRHPETRRRLIETFATGLSAGVEGPRIDMELFDRPWLVDFGAIRAPVRIWMGLQDRNVPPWGVRALAAALPGSDLVELPGAGHLWVAQNSGEVISWIASAIRPD
jgi:pimeloyl-ACP methyl ester carboxylesterase